MRHIYKSGSSPVSPARILAGVLMLTLVLSVTIFGRQAFVFPASAPATKIRPITFVAASSPSTAESASPVAQQGYIVYTPVPSAAPDGKPTRPRIYMRQIPSGRTRELLSTEGALPFDVITGLALDPTGRYLHIYGYAHSNSGISALEKFRDVLTKQTRWTGLWVLNIKTRQFVEPPIDATRTFRLSPTSPQAWCDWEPVMQLSNEAAGKTVVTLWNVVDGSAQTSYERFKSWDDHAIQCSDTHLLVAKWYRRKGILEISATGSPQWRQLWPLAAGWGKSLAAFNVSPDGERYAFSTSEAVVLTRRGASLQSHPISGVHQILWSPDGTQLALTSGGQVDPGSATHQYGEWIWIMNPVTGERQFVVSWKDFTDVPSQQHVLAWSKDGRRLILYKQQNGPKPGQYFWAYDIATKKEIPLWHADQELQSFAWHEGPPPAPLP